MTSPASGNGAGGWHEGPMSQWPPPLPGRWQPRPRLERNPEDAWLAGVASGIARHLGWPVGLVRAGFIILTLFNFLGLIVYGVLWVLIPEPGARRESPGLEAAERAGMRSATRMKLSRNWGALPALLVLGFLVSVTFYRCPHCHRVLPANRGKMDDCPYCKLPLRDTK